MLTGRISKLEDIKDPVFHGFKLPRFQPGNFEANLPLVKKVVEIAREKGCTPAQLAINWTRAVAQRPGMPGTIVPIPGATTVERVEENSKVFELTEEDMKRIDGVLAGFTPAGERYGGNIPMNT